MDMNKCHCSGVYFEAISRESIDKNCSYKQIAKEKNAGETCTACLIDMKKYCETNTKSQLQLQVGL